MGRSWLYEPGAQEATSQVSEARRVVASRGSDGRSRINRTEAIPPAGDPGRINLTNLWLAPIVRSPLSALDQVGFAPFSMEQMRGDTYAMTLVDYPVGHGSNNPGMHSTDTIDHFYVIAGEIVLVLEEGEALLRTGDVGIVQGAAHGWRNDGARTARLLFFGLPIQREEASSEPSGRYDQVTAVRSPHLGG